MQPLPLRNLRALLALVACALLLPSLGWSSALLVRTDANRRAERDLRRLEQQWSDAFNSRDARTLDRLLAADFVFVNRNGRVMNRSEYVDMVVNHIRVISGGILDLDIRTYGTTGIAVARFTGTTSFDGSVSTSNFRFIDVWTKRGGRWIAVSSQDTLIPD